MSNEFRGILYSVSGCASLQNESDVNSVSVEPLPRSTITSEYTTPPSTMWRSVGGGGLGGGAIGECESDSPISKCCIGHFIKGYKSRTGFVTPSFSPSNDRELESESDSASAREGPESGPESSGPSSRMQMNSRTVARRIDFSVSPPSTPRRNVCDDVSVRLDPEPDRCETSPVPSHETAESVVDGVSVGACSICYDVLPLRANHIYTMCGHLFCVKCLFKWAQQNFTCPMCRKPLYEVDDDEAHDQADDEADDEAYDEGDSAAGGDEAFIDEVINDETRIQDTARNNWNYRNGGVRASASFSLDGGEVMVIGRNVYPAWRRQYLIDRFIHDDDEFQWSGFVNNDDTVVPLTPSEVDALRIARSLAIIAIRHNIYQTILLSNLVFNGAIAHSFIPKTEYLDIPINRIGRDHFYEFVTCSRESPNPSEPRTAEANVFGFITEMTVTEARGAYLQENPSWESTHEYCFIIEVFDPLWNDGTYDETDGHINIQQFETQTLRFTDIRRMYSIWGAIRASV